MKMKFIVASALLLIAGNSNATNNDSVQQQLDDLKAGLHQVHINTTQKYSESWGLEDRANIGKLQEQKLDKSVFTADQQRQDKALSDVKLTAGQAFDIAVEGRATADNALTTVYGLIPQVNNNAKGIADLQESKVDKSVFTADQQRQDQHINAVQDAAQIANDRASNLEVRADGLSDSIKETNAQVEVTDKRSQNNSVRIDGVEQTNSAQDKAIASKVDTGVFKADQARQDEALNQETSNRISGDAYANSRIDQANAYIEANRQASVATNKRVAAHSKQLANHEQRLGKVESGLSNTNKRIDKVKDNANAGTATALAAAGIPQVAGEQRFSLGAAVGGYESEQAIAVGFSSRVSEKVVIKASVATDSQHGVGYNVGTSIGW